MIEVVYTRFYTRLPEDLWQRYLSKIPLRLQKDINRFRRWQDRQARLFGKLLLSEAFKRFGYAQDLLDTLSYNEFGRPFLNDRVDFNISHSGGCVVCAATDMGRVGIDIEEIRPIDLDDFKNSLTSGERATIKQADRPYNKFFQYWTMKESIIKANGQGLSVPLSEIHVHRNLAVLYDETWFLKEICIDPDYKCYLAADAGHADFIVKKASF